MGKTLKIGYIIADDMEIKPVAEYMKSSGAVVDTLYKRPTYTLCKTAGDRTVELTVAYSGIGKVNAAMTATALADRGTEILISSGFSGGMTDLDGVKAVLGNKFVEHDFNMTVLGYKPSQKPGQDIYVFDGDSVLNRLYAEHSGNTVCGTLVTGDCFVSDTAKRDFCVSTFGAVACDMETAAIASVAYYTDLRFAAIRFVSDSADESAKDSYRATNESEQTNKFIGIADWILSLTDDDELW